MDVLVGLSIGLGAGFGSSWLIDFLLKKQKIYHTRSKARDLIKSAGEKLQLQKDRILMRMEEYKQNKMEKQEQDLENIRRIQSEKQMEADQERQIHSESLQKLKNSQNKIQTEMTALWQKNSQKKSSFVKAKNEFQQKQALYVQSLKKKFDLDIDSLKKEAVKKWMDFDRNQILALIKKNEEDFKHNLKTYAHFILELVLSRFQHPYCSERGIKSVIFPNKKVMERLFGKDLTGMKTLEQECGVDIKISEESPTVVVFGIDPARRELGRAVLQKIRNKKHFKMKDLKPLVKEAKRELFWRIKKDGDRITRDLKLSDVAPEIKNLMGVLRYRYSFAQNQHFHCLEVGWLCGLLMAEIKGGSVREARRAGMLHDIGKAIDHSKEGGHAVIGADFIQKYGEDSKTVQAVRAHHYDTPPSADLDFLVIASDALSGARPGARRAAVESYTQKILTLEKIAHSFKGVTDTYIMSAGREIRVIVDSQKVNDLKALELSKKIAGEIEQQCSYPGLIKVTVVRTIKQNMSLQKLKQTGV